jgi:alkylated DNA repair dioxygenase AlkB
MQMRHNTERVALAPGFHLITGFLPPSTADNYYHRLRTEVLWEERSIRLFGKLVLQPRLVAWQGVEAYTYSGQTLLPAPFSPAVVELLETIEKTVGLSFNTVLLNFYRDGRDSMGLHADDEPEMGRYPVIASLSLGAERRFRIVPFDKAVEPVSLLLPEGSLLLMLGDAQRYARHELPKMPKLTEGRINLTFRSIQRLGENT